jgi:putative tricarboxylic transport membrane protein
VSTLEHTPTNADDAEPTRPDRAQYALAALLAVAGVYTLVDASTLEVGFADPVGPKVFPFAIGGGLVVLSILLAISSARGSKPEPEAGEDVDLTQRPDWLTVAKLVAVLAFTIATVTLLGWAVSGAALFAGSARVLGSRTTIRDVIVGAVLAVASWYGFYVGLGIPLTPGVLDGIL